MKNLVLFICSCCIVVTSGVAQNADVFSERVSMDARFINMLYGNTPVGSSAVWPQSLIELEQKSGLPEFSAYTSTYYTLLGPLSHTQLVVDTSVFFGQYFNRFRGYIYSDTAMRLQCDLYGNIRAGLFNNTASESFALGRLGVRAMGSLNNNLGFFLDLSNGAKLKGNQKAIVQTDPELMRTRRFATDDSSFFDRYVGYVQYQSTFVRLRFGREALQFGFSPIDNFVHSIDAPMLDGLLLDVPYKSVRFTMTHSAANGVDTSGFAVPGKFIATHRIAVDPTPWLSAAISDMIVYWGRGLDLTYLNPLAFFVTAGLGTEERNRNDNSMLGLDVAVRPIQGLLVYGSLIVDDLNYSSLSDTSTQGNNNKFAYQLGTSFSPSGMGSHQMLFSAEYARIDPFTFSHRSMNASYTTMGAPVGYDMNPNSDRLAVQARYWLTPRTYVRVDVDYTRHGENRLNPDGSVVIGEDPRYPGSGLQAPIGNVGGDIMRGDGDGLVGNRFLRGNVSHQRRLRLWFSAEWLPNVFTDVRVGVLNRNGGNNPVSTGFASLELRLGY